MAARPLLALSLLLASDRRLRPGRAPPPAPAPAAERAVADARLRQLFHDSDEDNLRRNPIAAMFRGDYRYAAHLGDYLSDAYFAAERAAAEHDLAALHAIDRAALNPTDRLAYDVFKYQREQRPRRRPARHAGADRGPPDQPFLGLPHLLSGVRLGPRRGAVPQRRGL